MKHVFSVSQPRSQNCSQNCRISKFAEIPLKRVWFEYTRFNGMPANLSLGRFHKTLPLVLISLGIPPSFLDQHQSDGKVLKFSVCLYFLKLEYFLYNWFVNRVEGSGTCAQQRTVRGADKSYIRWADALWWLRYYVTKHIHALTFLEDVGNHEYMHKMKTN